MDLKWSGYSRISFLGQAVLLIFFGVLVYQQNYLNAFQLITLLAGSRVIQHYKAPMAQLADSLYISIGVLNAWGWVWNWYHTTDHFDDVIHLLTTFAISIFVGYLFLKRVKGATRHLVLTPLIIASLGITLGTWWEVAEWLGFSLIGQEALLTMPDTIFDLVMDSIGALVGGLVVTYLFRRMSVSRS